MLECVVNVSEGRDQTIIDKLAAACGRSLLDVHSDVHHNRSVFTLASPHVEDDTRNLAALAVELIDLRQHNGVHPRIGVVDVVPFVPLPGTSATLDDAVAARNDFASWFGREIGVPCFLYGPEQALPDVRKHAFSSLTSNTGPPFAHPTAGSCAVGARKVLVAYNLWLHNETQHGAEQIARAARSQGVRTLALRVGETNQISCNLVDPMQTGPAWIYDFVCGFADIERAELVGLVPQAVLDPIPVERLESLDLSAERTIEACLKDRGLQ